MSRVDHERYKQEKMNEVGAGATGAEAGSTLLCIPMIVFGY